MPGFLSQSAVQETWFQYQQYLIDGINREVQGTTLADTEVKRLHEITAKDPKKQHLYNLAAQAHHNHFFFKGLSAQVEPDPITQGYREEIGQWFDSAAHLQEELTTAALSMFGNGYVWLVAEPSSGNKYNPLRLIVTFNAGTPYANAHAKEIRTANEVHDKMTQTANNAGQIGRYSGQVHHYSGVVVATPILCLKMWEHQYMRDYGLQGREQYCANWWKRIDWNEVYARLNHVEQFSESVGRSSLEQNMSHAFRAQAN